MSALTVDWTTARLLAAAGLLAAALPAAVTAPAVAHLPSWQSPVALTSATGPDISGAQAFLNTPGGIASNDINDADQLLQFMRGDAQDAFHSNSFADNQLNWGLFTDWLTTGQLYPGAQVYAGDVLPASGAGPTLPVDPAPTFPTDANPATDSTANEFYTGVINETNVLTANLQTLHGLADTVTPGIPTERGPLGDVMQFQEQLNESLKTLGLNQNDLTALQGNWLLSGFADSDLKGMLTSELNMNALSFELGHSLNNGANPMDLAGLDASMITDANTEYTDLSNLLGLLSLEQSLNDVSGWFSWL